MKPSGKVSVVVINFNNARYLDACLRVACSAEGVAEVIVVDDASSDESVSVISAYPVILCRNARNLGPVAARNVGARKAASPYILFLDSDVAMDSGYAARLSAYLDAHPDCGVVTGRVVEDGKARIWFNFGLDPSFFRDTVAAAIDRLALACWDHVGIRVALARIAIPFTLNHVPDGERRVDWVIESAMMARADVFHHVGGFDEGYRMFFEGPDLCRQIRREGYAVMYVPTASVRHLGGHSHSNARRRAMKSDSRMRYFRKWRS